MSSPAVSTSTLQPTSVSPQRSPRQRSPSPRRLSTPTDPRASEPINVAMPYAPRRMSISDAQLLAKALSEANAASRPSSAEAQRRARTRIIVPTSQPLAKDRSHTETFALEYSPDSNQLASACGDGSLRIFGASEGFAGHRLKNVLHHNENKEHLPATCVRYSPAPPSLSFDGDERNGDRLLVASYADGNVVQWRVSASGDVGTKIRSIPSTAGNSIYALAYQSDGLHFASAGRDYTVRLYDANTGQLTRGFGSGHANRVYALRFHTRDAHVLISGGWDNTVHIWDDRTGRSERTIFGPHICGDALDCNANGSELLTGSWREEHALQRWDFASGKLLSEVDWNADVPAHAAAAAGDASASVRHADEHRSCPTAMLYSCAYSPDDRLIAAGGSGNGVNQAKLFNAATGQVVERVSFNNALYTLAFSGDNKQVAMGGVDAALTIVNL